MGYKNYLYNIFISFFFIISSWLCVIFLSNILPSIFLEFQTNFFLTPSDSILMCTYNLNKKRSIKFWTIMDTQHEDWRWTKMYDLKLVLSFCGEDKLWLLKLLEKFDVFLCVLIYWFPNKKIIWMLFFHKE